MAEATKNTQPRQDTLFIYKKWDELTEAEKQLKRALLAIANLVKSDEAAMEQMVQELEPARLVAEQLCLKKMHDAGDKAGLAAKARYDVAVFLSHQNQACKAILDAASKAGTYRRFKRGDKWQHSGKCPYTYAMDQKAGKVVLTSNKQAAANTLYAIAQSKKLGVRRSYREVGECFVALGILTDEVFAQIRKFSAALPAKVGGKESDLDFQRLTPTRKVAQAQDGGLTASIRELSQAPR